MNEYVSVTELKASLELSGQSYADADLTLALTAASRAIDAVCDRRFYADSDANQVRYYSPTDPAVLWIDDLVTLTELAVDVSGTSTFSAIWTVNTTFFLEPLNAAADGWPYTTIRVNWTRTSDYFRSYWPRSVRVTGKFGWAAIPEGVKQATKIVAAKLVKRAREAPFGVISVFGPDAAIASHIASTDPEVGLMLAPFIRHNHAI